MVCLEKRVSWAPLVPRGQRVNMALMVHTGPLALQAPEEAEEGMEPGEEEV